MERIHKFRVGQAVELVSDQVRLNRLGKFEVVRIMPIEHGQRQYRIRSVADGHERVAIEEELA